MELFFHIRHHPPVTMAITPYSPFPSLPSFIYIYISYRRIFLVFSSGIATWRISVYTLFVEEENVNRGNTRWDPRV